MSCTHCGLCLESCPTYTLTGLEPESPRGRIVLIDEALSPGGRATAEMAAHIDSCLGCMACLSSCPEDVPYGDLLAAARTAVEREVPRPAAERLRRDAVLSVLPRSGRAGRLLAREPIPHHTPARGAQRGRVGLLLGCTQRVGHRQLHEATLAVLSAEGYEVIAPRLPDCCGAFERHSGRQARARRRAEATIRGFLAVGGVDHVLSSAGGCGATMKAYGAMLDTPEARAFSALALDVHELLARAPLRSRLGSLPLRIAYHDSCQLRHAQGIADAPRRLLLNIPGLELIELSPDAGACCGAPGIHRLTQPVTAAALGRRQARAVVESGAEMVLTADHACIGALERHLRELGHRMPVHHPIELIARAIAAGGSA